MAQEDTPNPVGRPTKYTPELLEKARAYANDHKVADKDDVVPMVEALALYLGITRQTVSDWRRDPDKQEFSDIVDMVLAKQTKMLFNGCLLGDLKENTAGKLLGKQGYTTQHQVDNISTDGSMKPTVIELVGVTNESSAEDTE